MMHALSLAYLLTLMMAAAGVIADTMNSHRTLIYRALGLDTGSALSPLPARPERSCRQQPRIRSALRLPAVLDPGVAAA